MNLFKATGMADNIDDYTTDLLDSTGFTFIDIMYELENQPEANAELLTLAESIQDSIHDGIWNATSIETALDMYVNQSIGES